MGLVTTSLRTSCAARVRERALQQGRHTRAATKTTWVAKEAMAGTGGAGDGRDGRRRGMLDEYLKETRSAEAAVWKRRAVLELVVVWCVGFGGWMYPTPNVVISGGTGMSLVLAGL